MIARPLARAARAAAASLALAALGSFTSACAQRQAPAASQAPVLERTRKQSGETAIAAQIAARMLVEHASLRLESNDLGALRRRADALVSGMGGYVQDVSANDRKRLRMQLRVPAASLDAALDTLRGAGKVREESRRAEDVTERVVDAEARLRNLIAVRDRLREHLGRAANVAEVIDVERELGRVQGEVDALEARLEHLRSAVALAELNLTAARPVVLGPLGWVAVGAGWVVTRLFVLKGDLAGM